jgi:hypothetical protein
MKSSLSRAMRFKLVLASMTMLAGFSFAGSPAGESPPPDPGHAEATPPSPPPTTAPAIPAVPTITPPSPRQPRTGPLRRLGQRVRLLIHRDRQP